MVETLLGESGSAFLVFGGGESGLNWRDRFAIVEGLGAQRGHAVSLCSLALVY